MAGGELAHNELRDRVVVITGGSRGIGREIVLRAAQQGACVAFCCLDLNENALQVKAAAEESAGTGRVIAMQADISRESGVDTLFDAALTAFGRVDVLINNAATSRPHLLATLPTEDWDHVINTNLTGAFLNARRAVREFVKQGQGGRIVNIGSATGEGAPSNASYAASKGGLYGLTRSIADEYGATGIYSFLLVAWYAETALTADAPSLLKRMADVSPQKRLARTDEIAAAALFLASDRACALVNGSTLDVSGGSIDPPVE